MPVVLRYRGFRFFFYSNEAVAGCDTNLRVQPKLGLVAASAHMYVHRLARVSFDASTLRELVEVAQTHHEMIERAGHDYFG